MIAGMDGWKQQPGDLLIADESGVCVLKHPACLCHGGDDETRGTPAFCFCLSSPWFSEHLVGFRSVGTSYPTQGFSFSQSVQARVHLISFLPIKIFLFSECETMTSGAVSAMLDPVSVTTPAYSTNIRCEPPIIKQTFKEKQKLET